MNWLAPRSPHATRFWSVFLFVFSAVCKECELDFQTTIAQMSILMLFNKANVYTIDQLECIVDTKRDMLISSLSVIVESEMLKIIDDDLESEGATLAINE